MDIVAFLKTVPALSDLSEESLGELAAGARIETYAPGEEVLRFGAEGTFIGVVAQGCVEACRTLPDGTRDVFATISPPGFFGEMSFITGEPTSADIVAGAQTKVVILPHEDLAPVVAREPGLATALARIITRRLLARQTDRDERERIHQARKTQNDPFGLQRFPLPGGGRLLTVNAGSSSLKYRLFDAEGSGISGLVERIGLEGTRHTWEIQGRRHEAPVEGLDHAAAFNAMMEVLSDKAGPPALKAVGHRVVHGGEELGHAVIIDDAVVAQISKVAPLAPLHVPANLLGIEEARRLLPGVPQVAVFDTGFHRTLPRHARIYGLPFRFYAEDGVRRYGFHGMSHKFVTLMAATFLRRPRNDLRIISCHLGNGASLAAVDQGRCVDTSMGMTPLEGLVMGTRSGDVDPGALLYLMREKGFTPDEMDRILQKEGGLLGISGVSSDMREILSAADSGNDRALFAVQTFCYRVCKYIGAFWAALGGLDAIVFTGGIGERSPEIRARICQNLSGMGVMLNEEANLAPDLSGRGAASVSCEDSPVKVLVIPTDEERMIARETGRALHRENVTRIIRQADRAIPVGVSAHHLHLSSPHVEALFGKDHSLTFRSALSQPGQFACEERVNLVGPKGQVERVRVLGPERPMTQVEISRTEEFRLGVDAPIRLSGNIAGTPGLTLKGPKGEITLEEGAICAQRHIHMTPEDALSFGVRDGDIVLVEVDGARSLIFGDVTARVSPDFRLEFHLDTDEANAGEVNTGMMARLHSIQSRR
jgi:acetate kinase